MRKLTDEQKALVEEHLPKLKGMLTSQHFFRLCHRLGWDDAYQVGCMAMMHAASKYKPEKGKFFTYCEWWLRHYLTREVERCGLMRDKNNRIAGRAGPRSVSSICESDDDTISGGESTPADIAATTDEVWSRTQHLGAKERAIVLMVAKGLHYHQIADKLKCSRESVRLIHEAAMNQLKYGVKNAG